MKKNLLLCALTVACLNTTPSAAQSTQLSNRHEVRMGVGFIWYPEFGYTRYGGYMSSSEEYYLGDKIGTPAINLSYSYQFKNWLSFGATLSYSGVAQKGYDLYTDAVYQKNNEHFISLTPTVRFDWFRTNTIKLYSSVGVGLGYHIETDKTLQSGGIVRKDGFTPTIDFNPIGISVGRIFFGFCELGLSTMGIVKAGVGYRFNDKSKR